MTYFEKCGKEWNCPSDRVLHLRAKLNTGWSIHTENVFRKTQPIPSSELEAITKVIQRARDVEQNEIDRIGRMVCRLENMTRNALGDGKKTCSMCGIAFGLFRSSYVFCLDCTKAVCEKCRVDTTSASLDIYMLCKICSENREVWKKSGAWFYGKLPTMIEAYQQEVVQVSGSPSFMRAYDKWEHRAPDIVRLQSFEPSEEFHNDKSQYKDWTMGSSPDLNDVVEENASYIELESFRNSFPEKQSEKMSYLSVQNPKLSTSCPALADLKDEPCKLIRKSSIRRKKISTSARKIIKKITNKTDHHPDITL